MQTVYKSRKKKLNQKPIPNSNYSRGKRQTGQHVKKSKAQPTGRDPESACLSSGHIQSAIYDEIKFGKKKSFFPSVSTNNWNVREAQQAVRLTNLWTVGWNIPHTLSCRYAVNN